MYNVMQTMCDTNEQILEGIKGLAEGTRSPRLPEHAFLLQRL